MKNIALLAYLVLLALVELPQRTLSFTATIRPSPLVGSVKSHHSSRRTTHLADSGEVEEPNETKTLLQKVKQAGTAGAISYALWELGFWGVSIPVCVLGYREVAGHWPDFTNKEDLEKVGAEAFAFVNFARLAVPLRIGLALSTTSWIDENVVQKFMKKKEEEELEG